MAPSLFSSQISLRGFHFLALCLSGIIDYPPLCTSSLTSPYKPTLSQDAKHSVLSLKAKQNKTIYFNHMSSKFFFLFIIIKFMKKKSPQTADTFSPPIHPSSVYCNLTSGLISPLKFPLPETPNASFLLSPVPHND